MDYYHGVPLPRIASLLVANATPQVDYLLAMNKGAAGSAYLASPNKVLGEGLAHDLKPAADVPLNIEVFHSFHD
jgi:hypothetical protein